MAQVAINWVATQPGVASVVIGASRAEQLDTNMAALDFEIPADARRRLDEAERAAAGWPVLDVHPAVPVLDRQSGPRYRRQAGRLRAAGLQRGTSGDHVRPQQPAILSRATPIR